MIFLSRRVSERRFKKVLTESDVGDSSILTSSIANIIQPASSIRLLTSAAEPTRDPGGKRRPSLS